MKKLKAFIRKRSPKIRHRLFMDKAPADATVLLAGTGRSGTTWLEDIINYRNSYRIMFEPFYSLKIPSLQHWHYRQYIAPSNCDSHFLKPATAILHGRERHFWIDQFNRKVFPRKRLIKDIRANLFLKWVKVHFPEIPILLLLRHPCAVANSKLIRRWDSHFDDCLAQDDLMRDHLEPFRSLMTETTDPFERHIIMWCIDNYVPLRQFNPGDILVTCYEDLCTEPAREIRRVLDFVGERFSDKVVKASAKPSALIGKYSAVVTGDNLTSSWRNNISKAQTIKAEAILKQFGLDALYDRNDAPKMHGDPILSLLNDSTR